MVAFSRFLRPQLQVNPLVPPVGGASAGLGVAALFLLVPAATLEDWVWASGLPALVVAAAPPLGETARATLALGGGAMAASVIWSALYLLFGAGGLFAPRGRANPFLIVSSDVRRASVRRDVPPRKPMTAADLGTPLMDVVPPPPVEQAVPTDLDQPMAIFDPGAIRPVPMPPPEKVTPIARQPIIAAVPTPSPELLPAIEPESAAPALAPVPLAPGERIDTYVLTPPAPEPLLPEPEPSCPVEQVYETLRPATIRRPTPQERPSIDALLRRLEEVTAKRMALGR